jgi:hypothetical protein
MGQTPALTASTARVVIERVPKYVPNSPDVVSRSGSKAVQEFMGHSMITETFDRYGHLFPGARDEARARMDAYLEAELALHPLRDPRNASR